MKVYIYVTDQHYTGYFVFWFKYEFFNILAVAFDQTF